MTTATQLWAALFLLTPIPLAGALLWAWDEFVGWLADAPDVRAEVAG